MSTPMIAFAGSPLDRADHLRANPEGLQGLMNASARLLRLEGLDPVIAEDGTIAWGSLADADPASELVFLGVRDERGCFAEVQPSLLGNGAPAGPRSWEAMQLLGAEDLAMYGGARSLVGWHARHRYCAQCGASTKLAKGGWQRDCQSETCKAEHFPRTDPVTIMIVEHNDSLLLGRQPRFPAKSYSALAGFVEPGETIEEAVARETMEEAGVTVRDVHYIFCQPWPYPSSLMIGCHAYADDPAITVDETELEDARWFSRADVADALEAIERGEAGEAFQCPPRFAIAHMLMRWWVEQGK
ncbi:MAG: NAD(+) diphosphatase [Novosphingobium sp.]|nr:NAD(+) diphosphatase [Novosphingobium sp.]